MPLLEPGFTSKTPNGRASVFWRRQKISRAVNVDFESDSKHDGEPVNRESVGERNYDLTVTMSWEIQIFNS